MSKSLDILISGAGIAAGAFTSWLLRAYPAANITIVERNPSLLLTGASVDIRSSAVDIIRWMGTEAEIRSNTTKEQGVRFVNSHGKEIATYRASGRTDVQTLTSEYEIFRGKLAEIFLKPYLDRMKLIFDETVESYQHSGDKVEVKFSKSKEIESYDLLVAADGLGSRIRGQMLSTPSREQIHDEGVHAAYFTINKDLLQGSKLAPFYSATGGRCIFLRPDPDPAGKTRALLMNIRTKKDEKLKERLDTAMKAGHEAYMELLEELYKDAGWLAPEVLRAMRESDDFYCSLFGQVRSPKLHDGRVVLLGDAGCATPGMGTSLAIMGGYVLAGELLRHDGDIRAAGAAYQQLMMPFVKYHQGGGADSAMQYMCPQTAWGIHIRNTVLGFVSWARLDVVAMNVAAWVGWSEKKMEFPDYPWPEP